MTSVSTIFFTMMGFLNTSLENGVCILLKCTMSKERSSGEDGLSKFGQAIVQGTNPDFFWYLNVSLSHKNALEN